jgi:sporulation protein YlmC with PRC-barrel domain
MTKKLMLGAALSALMLSGAFAQAPQSPSATPPAVTKSDEAKPMTPPAATKSDQAQPSGAGSAKFVTSQKPDQYLASKFKGIDVVGSDGKKIGDVSDILFDKNGKIEAYVVSVGGFLGMGAKEVALAPTSFTVEPGMNGSSDKLKLSMDQNELKQAQNFKPYAPPRPVTTGAGPSGKPLGGGTHPPGAR